MKYLCFILVLLVLVLVLGKVSLYSYRRTPVYRFIPNFVEQVDSDIPEATLEELKDETHGVKMGVSNDQCDNGKNGIQLDWDGSPVNYTCYPSQDLLPRTTDLNSPEVVECDPVPAGYMPKHHCMNKRIRYSHILPTHGDHRPLWPVFGEYKFVPPQRWLHNIEHGAVVMLYHPCTHRILVRRLRELVTNCIRKHVITPYNLLPEDKPLALVAWGCRMLMNRINASAVVDFIRRQALHGPEGSYPKEGQYTWNLIRKAQPPPSSDWADSNLCATYL